MRLSYIGHEAFSVQAGDGTRIICDPYRPGSVPFGLKDFPPGMGAAAVTISHVHPDHNYAEVLAGSPLVIAEPGEYRVGPLKVRVLDGFEGSPSGHSELRNLVVVIEAEGAKIVHLGDSGIVDDAESLAAISEADLVIVNIDGYVIAADRIMPFMADIRAGAVVPAHYSISAEHRSDAPTVEEFLATIPAGIKIYHEGSSIEVKPAGGPLKVIAMTPSNLA